MALMRQGHRLIRRRALKAACCWTMPARRPRYRRWPSCDSRPVPSPRVCDAPARQREDLQAQVVGLVAARPRPQRELPDPRELRRVLDLAQVTERQQAPSLLPHLVDMVDLEGHAVAAGRRGELAAGGGAEVQDVAL